MAPSIAEVIPGVDALNARAQVKLAKAYDSSQHASVRITTLVIVD